MLLWWVCYDDASTLGRNKRRIDAVITTIVGKFVESKVTCGGTKYMCMAIYSDGIQIQTFIDCMNYPTGVKWSMWVRCGTYHGTYYSYDTLEDLISSLQFNIRESMTNRQRRVSDLLEMVVEQLDRLPTAGGRRGSCVSTTTVVGDVA